MIRWLADARLDRWIERELTEGLSPRRRARLHQRLRTDPRARARYDRAVCALRVLEGDVPVAAFELDLVGRWLADDAGAVAPSQSTRRAWPVVLAAVAAALLLLWVSPLRDPGALSLDERLDESFMARGGDRDGLALEVLCGPAETPDPELRIRDCGHRDLMGFAYRVPEATRGTLTLFGVDADGDPMFYRPTPVDPAGVTVDPGRWQALPLGVRLWVNHAVGPLRVYGLVAPRVATPDQVRAWVQQLAPQSPAAPGGSPWIDRVDPSSLRSVCSDPTDCHAAELDLRVRP